jgi:hypothetical protein
MSKIGLKLANGEFYPVLDEDSAARKRLVVTTVQDGQRSVQIDIYRGTGPSVVGAEYVGSLVVDNIPFAPKGEPDIRLDLGLEADGKLSAYAEELSTGQHQSLELSLESLAEEKKYEIPDFAFEEEPDNLPPEAEPSESAGRQVPPYSGAEIAQAAAEPDNAVGRRRRRVLPIILFALLALVLALGAAYLVYRFGMAPRSGIVEKAQPVAVAPAPEAPTPSPAPAPAAPAAVETPAAAPAQPATPTPPPTTAKKLGGFNYKLKWGDTLWELSYTFYHNPWYFGRIARANKIRNPDFIIAGRTIWVPPR